MIYTIIVTYNGLQWIDDCIKSLLNSTVQTTILVVDNASTDATLEFIKFNYPSVLIMQQSTNLGFGKANNIGISLALKQGADFVFLLNQDARIEEDTLEELVNVASLNKDLGILSPLHYDWKGTRLEHYFKVFIQKNERFCSAFHSKSRMEDFYILPFVNAAAWLVPSKTLMEIGGFDPIFEHYGEDNNYCQRLHYHELKIGIIPTSKIYHDSKNRKGIEIVLFSDEYFKNELKQLQIRYADINRTFSAKDRIQLRFNILKLMCGQLLRLNLKNTVGYLKKYMIFEKNYNLILQSRELNKTKNARYIC